MYNNFIASNSRCNLLYATYTSHPECIVVNTEVLVIHASVNQEIGIRKKYIIINCH